MEERRVAMTASAGHGQKSIGISRALLPEMVLYILSRRMASYAQDGKVKR